VATTQTRTRPRPDAGRPTLEAFPPRFAFPRWLKLTAIAVLAALFLVTPLITADARLAVFSLCGVYGIATMGLTLLNGKTGLVTMGMPFFMAVGAYSTAFFGATLGLPFLAYLLIAVLIGAGISALMGVLAMRLGGDELAITTLGLLMVGQYLANEWVPVTGGESGMSVRAAAVGIGDLNFLALGEFTRAQSTFWLVWVFVAIFAYIGYSMAVHRPGRAMQAIHDSQRSAEAVGVGVRSYKVQVSAVAGAFGAVAGVLYAVSQQFVSPTAFGISTAILLFAMMIIGGMGRISGAVIGAFIVWNAQQLVAQEAQGPVLRWLIKSTESSPGLISVGAFNMLAYGLMIVLVLVFAPKGLTSIWDAGVAWWRRRRSALPTSSS
jgi:ABC-type branched-chain amino acid transport system, permease component